MGRTPVERQRIYEAAWQKGGFYIGFDTSNDVLTNQEANDTISDFIRSQIQQIVKDPAVADLLSPNDHPFGTKRTPLEHGYYEAFNRDNVTLIDVRMSPIEEITPTGLRTQEAEYRLDSIIYATGFDAMTGALFRMNIRGRDGLALQEKWSSGPQTYLGLASHGFPNLFMITGPQSPSVLSNMTVSIERHVEWISGCLQHMYERDLGYIEAQPEAEQAWGEHTAQVAIFTLYPTAHSWYVGANIPGKPRVFFPYVGGVGNYRKKCDEVAANGYEGFALATAPRA